MKVKNIKSYISFYESLEISTCISKSPRISEQLIGNPKLKVESSHPKISSKNEELDKLLKKIKSLNCNLKDIATNSVFSDGNNNSKIMLIGEAPGAEEDRQGKPFVGKAGRLLDKMLKFISLDRKKNFYVTNLVFWRPPGNRIPTNQEIKICLPITKLHIKIINPSVLILLGGVSSKAILERTEGIAKLRVDTHRYIDEENSIDIPARTIFHPAYLLRNPIEKKRVWDDLLEIHSFLIRENIGF